MIKSKKFRRFLSGLLTAAMIFGGTTYVPARTQGDFTAEDGILNEETSNEDAAGFQAEEPDLLSAAEEDSSITFTSQPSKEAAEYYLADGTADSRTDTEVAPLTVEVTDGKHEFSYQWYQKLANNQVSPVTGATEATYQPSTAVAGKFTYYVVATTILTDEDYAAGEVAAKATSEESGVITVRGMELLEDEEAFYEIHNGAELGWFRDLVNGKVLVDEDTGKGIWKTTANARLMNDIDMDEISRKVYWSPFGSWTGQPYLGEFDGNGHKLTNFYVGSLAGLCSYNKGLIHDLTIESGTCENNNSLCGMFVMDNAGTIANCVNKVDMISKGDVGNRAVGGIVSFQEAGGVIVGCVNEGDITFESSRPVGGCVGGLAGKAYGTIIDSYNKGTIKTLVGGVNDPSYSGGLVGSVEKGYGDDIPGLTMVNCYNMGTICNGEGRGLVGTVSVSQQECSDFRNNYVLDTTAGVIYNVPNGKAWAGSGKFVTGEELKGLAKRLGVDWTDGFAGYPELENHVNKVSYAGISEQPNITSNLDEAPVLYEKGAAAEELSVEASSLDEGALSYQWYRSETAPYDGTAIENATAKNYRPSTEKEGTAYYYVVVTNKSGKKYATDCRSNSVLVIVGDASEASIPQLTDGVYQISNAKQLEWFGNLVNGGNGVAVRDAKAKLTADIDMSEICGEDIGSWNPIGSNQYGAYTGEFDGDGHKLENCYIYTENGSNQGVFGYNAGIIRDLTIESGTVTTTGGSYCGSIAGYNTGTLRNCRNAAAITGRAYIGGIVGNNANGTLIQCKNTGDVVTTFTTAGGITANDGNGKIISCENTGTVTGAGTLGGIVGNGNGQVIDSVNKGAVTVDGYTAGGVVGKQSGGIVSGCVNQGAIAATVEAGGLIGNASGNMRILKNSYNTGAVNAAQKIAGGLIGTMAGNQNMENCYNTGSITAESQAAALIGDVTEANLKTAVLSNNYYLGTEGQAAVNGGELTEAQAQNKNGNELKALAATLGDAYQADTEPNINNGYPILTWQTEEEPEGMAFAGMPNVYTQPKSGYYLLNQENPNKLMVGAGSTDGGTLSYQWYKSENDSRAGGTPIAGATTAEYTVTEEELREPGINYYYVTVTNTKEGFAPVSLKSANAKVWVAKSEEAPKIHLNLAEADASLRLSITSYDGADRVSQKLNQSYTESSEVSMEYPQLVNQIAISGLTFNNAAYCHEGWEFSGHKVWLSDFTADGAWIDLSECKDYSGPEGYQALCKYTERNGIRTNTLTLYNTDTQTTATSGRNPIEITGDLDVKPVFTSMDYRATAIMNVGDTIGKVTVTAVGANQYELKAESVNSAYGFDHWEYDGETVSTEAVYQTEILTEDKEYKAVFVSREDSIEVTGTTAGIHTMGNKDFYPGIMVSAGHPITVLDQPNSRYYREFVSAPDNIHVFVEPGGTFKDGPVADGYVFTNGNQPASGSVTEYDGAMLWVPFKYFKEHNDFKAEIYSGESAEGTPLYSVGPIALGTPTGGNGQDASVYFPVEVMPYTGKVTVKLQFGQNTPVIKTLDLAAAMTDNTLDSERQSAIHTIQEQFEEYRSDMEDSSETYAYGSRYLMMHREYSDSMNAVVTAKDAQAISAETQQCLSDMEDAANGIYHQGVQVGESCDGGFWVVTLPENANVLAARAAVRENVQPNDWWYGICGATGENNVAWASVGIPENWNGPRKGILVVGGPVAGVYSVWDHTGFNGGNGIGRQQVWTGIMDCKKTGSPYIPNLPIKLLSGSIGTMQWDLSILRGIYSDKELLENPAFVTALKNQYDIVENGTNAFGATAYKNYVLDPNNEKDVPKIDAWNGLKVAYLDELCPNLSDDVKAVIRKIAAIDQEQPDETAVKEARTAYDALTAQEQKEVFNYNDLKKAEAANNPDAQKALEIDKRIDAIGTVTYTQESQDKISAARTAYDNASAEVQEFVTVYSVLTEAEETFAKLKEEAVKEAETKIQALPAADQAEYPKDEKAAAEAQEAFDKLLEADKEAFDAELRTKLEAVTAKINELRNAKADAQAEKMRTETAAWLKENVQNPGSGAEWRIFGLARDEQEAADLYHTYYTNMVQYVKEKKGDLAGGSSYTEYAKAIIALTAIGKDVTDMGGYNLLEGLTDMDKLTAQGINAVVYALLALDTADYEVPALNGINNPVTRDKLVAYILDHAVTGGGWTFFGDSADVDMTAMAIQALAKYYKTNVSVKEAVDKALGVLSKEQAADGGYESYGESNAESVAQVITALCQLGINPLQDARFLKDGNLVTALAKFYKEGGGFNHSLNPDGADTWMPTEQGYYALAAYNRLKEGKKPLYDMSETGSEGGGEEKEAYENVTDLINGIGDVTLDKESEIEEARAAYEALSADQKAKIKEETLKKLTDAENKLAQLKQDEEAVKKVIELIRNLGQITSLDQKAQVEAAANAYDALTAAQKAKISSALLNKLADAEAKLAELQKAAEAAAKVVEMIDKLGEITSPDQKAQVEAARAAYEELSTEQKALVTNYQKLKAAEAAIASLENLDGDLLDIIRMIRELRTTTDAAGKEIAGPLKATEDKGGAADWKVWSDWTDYVHNVRGMVDRIDSSRQAGITNLADLVKAEGYLENLLFADLVAQLRALPNASVIAPWGETLLAAPEVSGEEELLQETDENAEQEAQAEETEVMPEETADLGFETGFMTEESAEITEEVLEEATAKVQEESGFEAAETPEEKEEIPVPQETMGSLRYLTETELVQIARAENAYERLTDKEEKDFLADAGRKALADNLAELVKLAKTYVSYSKAYLQGFVDEAAELYAETLKNPVNRETLATVYALAERYENEYAPYQKELDAMTAVVNGKTVTAGEMMAYLSGQAKATLEAVKQAEELDAWIRVQPTDIDAENIDAVEAELKAMEKAYEAMGKEAQGYIYNLKQLELLKSLVEAYRNETGAFLNGAPTRIAAKTLSYNSVEVTWKPYEGAEKYYVYRRKGGEKWKRVAIVNGLSYVDPSAVTNTTYKYTVKAATGKWGKTMYSKWESGAIGRAVLAQGTLSSVKSYSYNMSKLIWKRVDGATGYQIYRAAAKNGSYKLVGTVANGSTIYWKDKGLSTGKTYYYKVRAYRTVSGVKKYGSFSAVKSAKIVPAPAVITKISAGTAGVKLVWTKRAGVSGYQVYRAASENGTYTKVGVTKNTGYTDSKTAAGKTYYYKVRTYRVVNGTTIYGAYSDIESVKAK